MPQTTTRSSVGERARWPSRGQADRWVRCCSGGSVNCPTRCDRSDGTMTSRRHSATQTRSSTSPGPSNPTSRIPTVRRTSTPPSPPPPLSHIHGPTCGLPQLPGRAARRVELVPALQGRGGGRAALVWSSSGHLPVRSHLRAAQRARPDRVGVRREVRQSHAARQWDPAAGSAVPRRCCGSDPPRRARSRNTDRNVRVRRTRHHDCRKSSRAWSTPSRSGYAGHLRCWPGCSDVSCRPSHRTLSM